MFLAHRTNITNTMIEPASCPEFASTHMHDTYTQRSPLHRQIIHSLNFSYIMYYDYEPSIQAAINNGQCFGYSRRWRRQHSHTHTFEPVCINTISNTFAAAFMLSSTSIFRANMFAMLESKDSYISIDDRRIQRNKPQPN